MDHKVELYDFYIQVTRRAFKTTERYGQALFNHLWDVRPDLSEQIRGTSLDPFYTTQKDDPVFSKLDKFLLENWNKE